MSSPTPPMSENDDGEEKSGYYTDLTNIDPPDELEHSDSNDSNDSSDSGNELPPYSPKLRIEAVMHKDKVFHVVRDDYLVGGSKQRGMVPLLQNSEFQEFVYGGPNNGYAQIALAYAAQLTGKKCTLFVAKIKRDHPFTIKAKKMGAKVMKVYNGYLKTVQAAAEKYVSAHEDAELVPFGGGSEIFVKYMTDNIRKALPRNLREDPPERMWLVGGSATLLRVLYDVFPQTKFFVVQVGKTIWEDQLEMDRTTKYVAAEKFHEDAVIQPPYPTVSSYDAKVWVFAAQHGQSGDYIWNVAKDLTRGAEKN